MVRLPALARSIDDLGRLVLPSDVRKQLGIKRGDYLNIELEDDHIILTKVEPACLFCHSLDQLISYRDKLVCPDGIKALGSFIGEAATTDKTSSSPGGDR